MKRYFTEVLRNIVMIMKRKKDHVIQEAILVVEVAGAMKSIEIMKIEENYQLDK